ncbi:MAG TPA: polysaccharide biosynthesis tyrosine autokinase [Solimonas sp.]|nr:polysaccharide biosynthesis tyrosine autokinase [Solimonas sp.]
MNNPDINPNLGQQLSMPGPSESDAVGLHDIIGVFLEGRLLIALTVLIGALLAGFYGWVATPIYRADALVQVETKDRSMNAALGDVAELLGAEAPVTAEIEIIRSRMVVGKVVDTLQMDVVATPRYLPLIGEAIVRSRGVKAELLPPLLGFRSFAWGGEKIRLSSLKLPPELVGKQFLLRATQRGFLVFDPEGSTLFQGEAGKTVTAQTPWGEASIFVQELRANPGTEFDLLRMHPAAAIAKLQTSLQVLERGKQSGMISLSIEGEDRAGVAAIVNQIAVEYQKQNVERRSAEAAQTLEFLGEQLPKLKEQLEAAEAAINQFRLRQGSADLTKETELILQQSVTLESERMGLMQRRQEAMQRFTSSHPVIQALDGQIAQIGASQGAVLGRVKNLPETQQELLRLSRDVEVNTQMYTALLNNSQELQIAKAGTVGNVRVVDVALAPRLPAKPRKGLIVLMGVVLGAFAGVLLVFVRRALHRGIEDPSIVEQQLGLPTYASVPFSNEQRDIARAIKRGKGGEGASQILAVMDSQNVAVEALRSLRTSLHFALLEANNNIVMLTGPSPGLGKSFISINLGAVLAMSGKSVVVIDADLRRGHLHDYLSAERTPGVSDYVAGDATLEQITKVTEVQGLSFIPTGTVPPNPAELLLHERFTDMLKQLSEKYDHVLVDTPPVLAVTDAAVIGRHAGCTLLVLKAGEHPLRAIEETARRLRHAGVQLRGTLFNQIGSRGAYGYGNGYGYGYGYGYKYGYSYAYRSKK